MMDQFNPGEAAPVERPRRGWLSRNWLWFVPAVLLLCLLLCGGLCAGIAGLAFGVIKSSDPYQMALKQVQNDPQVVEQLGQPIEESGWFPMGQINVQNSSGDAELEFDVAGPRGTARVHTKALRENNQWRTTVLEVTTGNGERIDLIADENAPLPEMPLPQF